ncbi:hypothetical protein PR202_ga07278 [Eleusine coracana subsp. coracana]|uniref:F-box domain-containing protein n=1 Tax=Eleusine coracana subsp. coracana TaxID=191504 RepID=A0AAV5BXL3_ELECO|nr:hypothetical protein QOZ80_2AG0110280 [Eleusine coracana subsp. coracana]GJM90951.1 hypothetical protein PR202_ga07278 [Eleusine coracana subsp. coracana]
MAATISAVAVLGDDDLLCEILLRLGFPTTLVRAAAVSRRWLRIASDRAFLRARHPPRLLGFYYHDYGLGRPYFVPISQAPELAGAVRLASSVNGKFIIRDSRDGCLLVSGFKGCNAVLDPLHPRRNVAFLPQPQYANLTAFFADDGGAGGVVSLSVFFPLGKTSVNVGIFQCGAWTFQQTAAIDVPGTASVVGAHAPVQGKIYIMTNCGYILQLDLASISLSVIQLPEEVKTSNFKLSCGEHDSGFFLIQGEGCLISIWRHEVDGDGTHHWAKVSDTFCVQEAFTRQEDVTILEADDNLEYVFLGLNQSKCLISLNLRSRTEIVHHEFTANFIPFSNIKPLMMVWPPVFPAAKEENVLEE